METPRAQFYLNDFATRSFRDVADQDYIAARGAHRDELVQPFLWSALQCLEKYLKAILLYNNRSAKRLGHDLEDALRRVEHISDLEFSVSADCRDFVHYLNRYGQDRYLSTPTVLKDDALLCLDKTVWQVRRYCYDLTGEITWPDGRTTQRLQVELKRIRDPLYADKPSRYRLNGGYLERVIGDRLPSYTTLTWKNFYYGRRQKRLLKDLRLRLLATNPTHAMHPEFFPELAKLVDFPRYIRDYYLAEAEESIAKRAKERDS